MLCVSVPCTRCAVTSGPDGSSLVYSDTEVQCEVMQEIVDQVLEVRGPPHSPRLQGAGPGDPGCGPRWW